MKDSIILLSQKNKNNLFLKKKLELKCKCGHSEKITYYSFLSGGEFNVGQPIPTISPFISETIYEETINVTPLTMSKKCPVCGEKITVVFPLSVEDLIAILNSEPPDPQMYG